MLSKLFILNLMICSILVNCISNPEFFMSFQSSFHFRLNTDFVAWRGHFTKFLCTPYETREPWKMAVTLFNGTIYISEVETEKAEFDRKHRSPRQKEMCYWGFRFEGYLTKPMHGMRNQTY